MPKRSVKTHELIREQLSSSAIARGRQLYLSSGVRELRIDIRRRRYSAIVDDAQGAITVKVEHGKSGPSWLCSADGRDNVDCPHVAALITGVREREAIDGEDNTTEHKQKVSATDDKTSLVDHLMLEADRDHLIQAFKLCLRTYPELQGDLVFTILENIDAGGELYDEVVALMDDPSSSKGFTLPKEGFDPYRLLDEINYLYEQEKFQQCFLLSRAMIARLLGKMAAGKVLAEHEVDLVIASSGMLSDLTLPPVPKQLGLQVHELGLRLIRRFPKLEPQIQSSLIALIDDSALDQEDLEGLEKSLRRRWERARKTGKSDQQLEEAERLAMPLALFYARTRQFDKLQNLFDRYLQNPLLRAPALAEMLHHNLQEVVVDYVIAALVIPEDNTRRDDHEDIARCGMYNDLVMMLLETMEQHDRKIDLLKRAFESFGHRIYGILDVFKEVAGQEIYESSLQEMATYLKADASEGIYVAMTKYFVVLGELERFDEAYELLVEQGAVDPVILLDYLPQFLPKYADQLFEPALLSVVELLPLVTDDGLRNLVRNAINRLWDVNEVAVRDVLERNFADIIDDELADFVDVLLGDFGVDELDF